MSQIIDLKSFKVMVLDLIKLGFGRWDPELEVWHLVYTKGKEATKEYQAKMDTKSFNPHVKAGVIAARYERLYYDVLLKGKESPGKISGDRRVISTIFSAKTLKFLLIGLNKLCLLFYPIHATN